MEYYPGFFVPADARLWAKRMEAGCEIVEQLFGIKLELAHSGTKNHATEKAITNRLDFFAKRLKTKNRWFSIFSGHGMRRTSQGVINVNYFCLGGNIYSGDELFRLNLVAPPQSLSVYEKLLVALGDAIEAQSAQFTPAKATERLRKVHWYTVLGDRAVRDVVPDKTEAEASLPLIGESTYAGLQPYHPHHIGWLNYWSQEVCEYVGFPNNAYGLESVMQHSYRTPRGAWIVKVGPDPIEAGNDAQMRLLQEMYERFPKVGVRPSEGLEIFDFCPG
jgi:hypothetical protein